jgi:hypothetical protein
LLSVFLSLPVELVVSLLDDELSEVDDEADSLVESAVDSFSFFGPLDPRPAARLSVL